MARIQPKFRGMSRAKDAKNAKEKRHLFVYAQDSSLFIFFASFAFFARNKMNGEALQPRQHRLDRLEIWEVFGRGRLLGVANHARLIDHKRGTCGHAAEPTQVGQEDAIGGGGRLVQVAGKRQADALLLRPGILGERTVHTHGDDFRIEPFIGGDAAGKIAHFLGANPGEREREKEQDGVCFAELIAEFDVRNDVALFGFNESMSIPLCRFYC